MNFGVKAILVVLAAIFIVGMVTHLMGVVMAVAIGLAIKGAMIAVPVVVVGMVLKSVFKGNGKGS